MLVLSAVLSGCKSTETNSLPQITGTDISSLQESNHVNSDNGLNEVQNDGDIELSLSEINEDFSEENTPVILSRNNILPYIVGESILISEDESITLSSLLLNDEDEDGDELSIVSFSQSANGGIIEFVDTNSIKYTPSLNFHGQDHFNYLVSDGRGGEAMGTVYIDVVNVNDTPLAKVDSFMLSQGLKQVVNVLENDKGLGDEVEISIMSSPTNGVLEVGEDGKISYLPNGDYFGKDSFVYQIKDADGETSIATAELSIKCIEQCSAIFAIAWEPSVGLSIESYKVYYGAEATSLDQVIELANVTNYEHFVDTKGEYFFAVSAVNDQNVESDITDVISGIF